MSAPTHGLELGSLDLATATPHDSGCVFSVLAAGFTTGSPQAVVKAIVSMLADGDLVSYDRAGNRVVSFDVQIEAPDGQALADGEVVLRRELYRRNVVTWTPPAEFGPPTVYEVVTSEMAPKFDDIDELRTRRVFTLTLTCSPFARSLNPVTVEALDVGAGAEVVVDACDSATGWTATVNGAPFGPADPSWLGQSGSVWVHEIFTPGPQSMSLIRTGTFSVATTPYVRVNVRANEPLLTTASAIVDGTSTALTLISQRKSPASGDEYEFLFSVPAGSASLSELTVTNYSSGDYAAFGVSEVARKGAPSPYPRQTARVLQIGGTERTPASIHMASANGSDPLGLAIVHTCPEDGSGYSPPLRRWRVSGQTETPSSTAFSGKFEPIAVPTNAFFAEIPTTAIPEGGYTLAVRVHMPTRADGDDAAGIAFSVSTEFPDSTTREGYFVDSVDVQFPDADWLIVPLATLTLPTVRTKAGLVQVAISASTANPQVYLDEAWLFREDDDCALSIVKTDRPHLWLDSPDASSPVPTVWVGDGAATRVHPGEGLQGMGAHVLSPDGTAVFAAALTDNPATGATGYRRWHSNAAS